ncbi:MAG: DUF554 domain-containing protein [candidate division WOR-3 bacterium]
MRILGTLINAGAVIAGSLVGLVFHTRLPRRLTEVAFQGIGLFTLFIGFTMAAKTQHLLVLVFSIVLGAVAGELAAIDRHLNRLGDWLKTRLKSTNARFTEGMVAAFLLFCMGSMTVLGAIEEGLGARPNLLVAKSVLDGFASAALAASLGVGVLFSVIPLVVYQGTLTIFASSLRPVLSDPVVNEITAVGGLILVGLGINILELRQLRVLNMLPALVVAGVLAALFVR